MKTLTYNKKAVRQANIRNKYADNLLTEQNIMDFRINLGVSKSSKEFMETLGYDVPTKHEMEQKKFRKLYEIPTMIKYYAKIFFNRIL